MKTIFRKIISLFLLLIFTNLVHAQEWKNFKQYQKETKNAVLVNGCWLKKDRKKQTTVWNNANKYNLTIINGYKKYKTITQIRDFYLWFDAERIKQGHEIKWIGISAIAIDQLSKLDSWFVRTFIVRNKEVVNFAKEGASNVFSFAFPKLKDIYCSTELVKGKAAKNWDKEYGTYEQCIILEPLFNNLSDKAFFKLERMVKGKGIFTLGIPKILMFDGALDNCQTRVDYGYKKILPYYLTRK